MEPIKATAMALYHVLDCGMGLWERVGHCQVHAVIDEANGGLISVENSFDEGDVVECVKNH